MSQQAPISFQIRTKNVLIIDGNEAMQKVRASVLRSRGVHVHTAKSVAEAELLWVPDFFDLVLLDVRTSTGYFPLRDPAFVYDDRTHKIAAGKAA